MKEYPMISEIAGLAKSENSQSAVCTYNLYATTDLREAQYFASIKAIRNQNDFLKSVDIVVSRVS